MGSQPHFENPPFPEAGEALGAKFPGAARGGVDIDGRTIEVNQATPPTRATGQRGGFNGGGTW